MLACTNWPSPRPAPGAAHARAGALERLLLLLLALLTAASVGAAPPDGRVFRIVHVMSYQASWEWNVDQLRGFQDALKDLNVRYQVFEMDSKRHSDEAWKRDAGRRAVELIETTRPDLVYVNDDTAQEYVTRHFVNAAIPFVYSGVNRQPAELGIAGARNITGVLEQEHFVETVNLLRRIRPQVRRVAVLVDPDPTWQGILGRMRDLSRRMPDVEITEWVQLDRYDAYQAKVLELQDKVDAIATLGVFNLKDGQGRDVGYEQVLRWTAEHSRLPDFSFWDTRVERGTLCVVAVSGHEQGYQAGLMARDILLKGVAPGSIPPRATTKGRPVVSLARARALGVDIPAEVLLSAKVITRYDWERR